MGNIAKSPSVLSSVSLDTGIAAGEVASYICHARVPLTFETHTHADYFQLSLRPGGFHRLVNEIDIMNSALRPGPREAGAVSVQQDRDGLKVFYDRLCELLREVSPPCPLVDIFYRQRAYQQKFGKLRESAFHIMCLIGSKVAPDLNILMPFRQPLFRIARFDSNLREWSSFKQAEISDALAKADPGEFSPEREKVIQQIAAGPIRYLMSGNPLVKEVREIASALKAKS